MVGLFLFIIILSNEDWVYYVDEVDKGEYLLKVTKIFFY